MEDSFQYTDSFQHTAREDSPVEVATPPVKSWPTRGRQKRTTQNKNAPRQTAWTNEEEIVLCKENTRLKDLATTVERLSENNTQRDIRKADHVNRLQNVERSLEVIHRSIEALTRGSLARLFDEKNSMGFISKTNSTLLGSSLKTTPVNSGVNSKCINKQCLVLLTTADELEEPFKVDDYLNENTEEEQVIDHQLSLNAFHGSQGLTTIRFTGTVNGTTVQVLLDGGSSDNFIQPRIAKHARLPLEPAKTFKVMVGNGNFLQSEDLLGVTTPVCIPVHGVAKRTIFDSMDNLGKLPFHEDICSPTNVTTVMSMGVRGADIILGAAWLATLRCIQHSDMIPLDLVAVLSKFSSVFELPIGLPPFRSHDHSIVLQEGVNAIKVRPYSVYRSVDAESAFDALKHAPITAPILHLPDFTKPFIVETDASGYGIGVILSQYGHPNSFFSKKFSSKIKQASTYVHHRSLRHLTNQILQTLEQEAFLPKLLGYNFTIEYKAASPYVPSLLHQIEKDPDGILPYFFKDGLLYWKRRDVVPLENLELITKLLVEFHSSPIGGHAGFLRTYALAATYFFWPGMRRAIHEFVRSFQICHRAKSCQLQSAGFLSPLPIPNQVWEDIAMDFITGLPNFKGYTIIMVVIDRLSKYAHFAPLRANYNAPQVVELFVQTVMKHHGIPHSIVSDRDKVFTSAFWSHLFKLLGTTLNMSSAYHPQSDGQSEALNKCLELYLRCFIFENPRTWITFLPWAEFWYNSAIQTFIGMTPFKVLYGSEPSSIISSSAAMDTPIDVHTQLQARDVLLSQLKINLTRA
nr:hypothetical protein [Tanacetum cinerariifolium]